MALSRSLARIERAFQGAAIISLALSGTAAALSLDEIANYDRPDRQSVLEQGARKEGELLWMGGINEKTASTPILKAFMEKYPYIKARYLRTGTAEGLQRILAEARARSPHVDLFNGNAVVDLKQAGLAQTFRSPSLDAYPDELKDPQHFYANLRFSYQGVALWNTKLVSAAEAPKSHADLVDPRFKGRMVASDSAAAGMPFLITFFRKLWGEKQTLDYLEKLAKQDVKISAATTRNLADLVIAGEHDILISPANQHIGQARGQGAPIEGILEDPVLARNDYVLLLKNAPHPHAAMLAIDFMLERPAQEILLKAEYSPAHPAIEPEGYMREYTPRSKGFRQYNLDDEVLYSMMPESIAIFRRLFQ